MNRIVGGFLFRDNIILIAFEERRNGINLCLDNLKR